MSHKPDPRQPEPDQHPYGPGPSAWPGPPWEKQPPGDPPRGPQPRRAQGQDPPPRPKPMRGQGQPPMRKTFGWLALSLAAVGGLIVGGVAGSLGASVVGGTANRISDGSYEVGVDIHPGRYKTVTPAEDNGSVCYAEVYTADDPLEPYTLETEMTYSGLTIIDIPKKTGAIFWSEGCGEWKKIA